MMKLVLDYRPRQRILAAGHGRGRRREDRLHLRRWVVLIQSVAVWTVQRWRTFQQLMQLALSGLSWEQVLDYIDDLIVHSGGYREMYTVSAEQ